MNELLVFAGAHPILATILVLIIAQATCSIVINLPNRIMRHWNIYVHGYPPPHCDADGDFKPQDSK